MARKKLCIFTLYGKLGASSNYRILQYCDVLKNDYEIEVYPFWNDEYSRKYIHNKKKYALLIGIQFFLKAFLRWYQLSFIAPHADAIFIQKGCIPYLRNNFLRKVKKADTAIIFDVDDAIYLKHRDYSDEIAKISHTVICGNETLKTHYSKFNPNCVVIPTTDNTHQYEPFWKDTFDKKVLGWIGSSTTLNNLDVVSDAINDLIKKHPEVEFRIISDSPGYFTSKIINCVFVPWEKETYINNLSELTVGIMPLFDNDFNRGKCGFKLIQYLNMKKPVVGSDVGINGEIIKGNGIVASTREEWLNALETLLYSKQIYQKSIYNIEKQFFKRYHIDNVYKAIKREIENANKG